MSTLTLYLSLFLALLGFGGTVGGYFYGRHEGKDLQKETQLESAQRVSQARDAMLTAASEAIGKLEVKQTTIRQEVQTLVKEVPVYRDARCVNTPDGLRLINAALTGTSQSPDPSQLSGTDAAHGSVVRGDGAEAGGSGGAVPQVPDSGPR